MAGFWDILGRGCLAAGGSSVLFMLSNEPADVTSRISHWYEFWQGNFTQLPAMPPWLTDPAADTVAYAVGIGFIALAAVPTLAEWMRRSRRCVPDGGATVASNAETGMASSPVIDQRVTSHGQSGGITARTVVNRAPKPRLNILNRSEGQNADGTYTTRGSNRS